LAVIASLKEFYWLAVVLCVEPYARQGKSRSSSSNAERRIEKGIKQREARIGSRDSKKKKRKKKAKKQQA